MVTMKRLFSYLLLLLLGFIPIFAKAESAVAKIGDIEYYIFEDAVNALKNNDTLEILTDITYSVMDSNYYWSTAGNNITIKLNGHTITFKNGSMAGQMINVAGTLNLVGDGTINMALGNGFTIKSDGLLIIDDVIFTNKKAWYFSQDNMFNVEENGKLKINSGNFSSINLVISNLGETTINNGEFYTGLTTTSLSGENINIYGGTFTNASGVDNITSYLKEGYIQDENGKVIPPEKNIVYEWDNAPDNVVIPESDTIVDENYEEVVDKTFHEGYKITKTDESGIIIGYWEFSGWEKEDNSNTGNTTNDIVFKGNWNYKQISNDTVWNKDEIYHWIHTDKLEKHKDEDKDGKCDVCLSELKENPNTTNSINLLVIFILISSLVVYGSFAFFIRRKKVIKQFN